MTASRNYSSTAGQMFLTASITSGSTSIAVTSATGLPSTLPYTLLLDPGTAAEEVVTATGIGGLTITITRGVDGTGAQSHLNGAEVRHGFSARDFQDSRNHEGTGLAMHGLTGSVVGTSDTQTLTGKSISGSTNTFTNIPIGGVTNGVDLATTQTLTNKHIDYNTNTITNLPNPSWTPNAVVARITADSASATVGTPLVTIVTAPSITGNGAKRFKITGSVCNLNGTSGMNCYLQIMDGATVLLTQYICLTATTSGPSGLNIVTTNVPATGAHTYTLVLAYSNTSVYVPAGATTPAEIIVEQIA